MEKEPEKLIAGKEYHKTVQGDWQRDSEGDIGIEKTIKKENGSAGRIDIHVKVDNILFY